MFRFESFFGYIKRFIRSKVYPEANLVKCYRLLVFGRILRVRYPDMDHPDYEAFLLQPEHEDDGDQAPVGGRWNLGHRFRPGVVAPVRGDCRVRKRFDEQELRALYILLDYDVKSTGRKVKSNVEVNGEERTVSDSENASKRRGKTARRSGVELSAEHSPPGCERMFGVIRYFAYTTKKDGFPDHVLVARVDVLGEVERGRSPGEFLVDPRQCRRNPFFVRACDLGRTVGFVPVHVEGDGNPNIHIHSVDFWDRKQYVVYCYPVD
jgi:hypothetical protein